MATRGAGEVKIRVNALPMCEDEAHPYLTCFQHSRAFFERTRTVRVSVSYTHLTLPTKA